MKLKLQIKVQNYIVNPEISKDQKNLKFNFGLIRKNEFFQFEALIESNNRKIKADEIYKEIEVSHRIAHTKKICFTSLLSEEQLISKKKSIRELAISSAAQFLFFTAVIILSLVYLKPTPISYKCMDGNSYLVDAKSNENIVLTNITNKVKKNISIADLQSLNQYTPVVNSHSFWYKMENFKYVFIVFFLGYFFIIGDEYRGVIRSQKFHNLCKPK